ncbi:mucolipin-3-like [Procambarus clarkii]|uniref:mucolipin-3-like n=1 Tax=Procambarus clarkii TaxID=6728 RepID=UPI003742470A
MNPANHGQCHIRRGSRDERVPADEIPQQEEEESAAMSSPGQRQQPRQAGGHPSQGEGDPSQGEGDPSQGEGDPSQGEGNPSQSEGDPSQGEGNPSQGEGNPSQGEGDPSQGEGDQFRKPHQKSHRTMPRRPISACSKRGRSGSWSRVNDSNDELEKMTQALGQAVPEIKVSTAQRNGCSLYGSITSSVNSVGSTTSTGSTTGLFNTDIATDRMRCRLKFYHIKPILHWFVARQRFPHLLVLPLLKSHLVPSQLCLFAHQRCTHINFLWDTQISFSHLFLQGWDSSREIKVYPPTDGALAVYTKSEFFGYLDYAVLMYNNVEKDAIGAYVYKHQNGSTVLPYFCATHYPSGKAFLYNNSYVLDDNTTRSCISIPISETIKTDWSMKTFLIDNNFALDFDILLGADLNFVLKTVKLRVNLPFDTPECYEMTSRILFSNRDHDGQMVVDLQVGALVLECDGSVQVVSDAKMLEVWRSVINITTIAICITSLTMCIRAIYRAQLLRKCTAEYFQEHRSRELTLGEKLEFVNLWYVLICINDILIIIGSFLKIGLESKSYEGYLDTWNVCSLFLGLGNLLVWFGCLRYLGFFTTYNVLILTVKKAIPNVMRFSICLMMVFAGYCLCGWLVLSPYHLKFQSFSSTMECLYSLINGDDMFATFSSTSGKDPVVWWFSRLYLYSFISLFIYVILSLFIAIIMDAYETIKNYYNDGFPESGLMKFINECIEEPTSSAFQDEGERTIHDTINSFFCCDHESRRQRDTECEAFLS